MAYISHLFKKTGYEMSYSLIMMQSSKIWQTSNQHVHISIPKNKGGRLRSSRYKPLQEKHQNKKRLATPQY